MTKTPLTFALAVMLAACASEPNAPDEEFLRLAAQTESEIRQAEQTGFLWRDTEQLLEDARQAKKQGRDDEAMTLMQQARRQAQLAQQQAKDNAKAGPAYPAP